MHGRFQILVWAWCLPLMLAVTAAEVRQGEVCSAKCGNVTISNPFWFTDLETGRSCGSPGSPDFQLTCFANSYPVLPSSVSYSYGFAILNISYVERSLSVVDLGKLQLLDNASNSFNSCLPIWNTSVILGAPFRIASVNLELILYNCTEKAAAARREKELVQAKTMMYVNASNAFVRAGVPYDPVEDYAGYALEGCDAIVLPVLGLLSGETNVSHYERLIQTGFLLKWELPPPLRAPAPRNEPPPPRGSQRRAKKIILIGITSAAATFLSACLYVLIWHREWKGLWFLLCKTSSKTEKNYEAMIVSYGSLAPKRYMYSEVMKITSSRNNQLGKGRYGVVFKGKLHDGRLAAMKFLHDCKENGDEFVNEVMSIGRTSHVNVVSLFELCLEGSKESKLSMTGARGTIGFIAPEVHSRTFGVVSTKSDGYSYGMMLLEMVGGRRNVKSIVAKSSEKYFPDWIYNHFAQDDGLEACEVTNEIEEIARKMILIGLWCIQVKPLHRLL